MKKVSIFLIFLFLINITYAYEIEYIHQDHLGNNIAVTDQEGKVVWNADYEPFGDSFNELNENNNYKYNNKEVDVSTGLLYYGARYYDADIGRFTTPDPVSGSITAPQSLNRYVYVQNNPMKYVDPSGNVVQFAPYGGPSEETKSAIIGSLNYVLGEQLVSMNKEGVLALKSASFEPETAQSKIYNMLNDMINNPDVIIYASTSKDGFSFRSGATRKEVISRKGKLPNPFFLGQLFVGNVESISDPFGNAGSSIDVSSPLGPNIIHELQHARNSETSLKLSETSAVEYENYARSILGLPLRVYYHSRNIYDPNTGDYVGLGLYTPQTVDKNRMSFEYDKAVTPDTLLLKYKSEQIVMPSLSE
jgi:RHS repeat-associated protein